MKYAIRKLEDELINQRFIKKKEIKKDSYKGVLEAENKINELKIALRKLYRK